VSRRSTTHSLVFASAIIINLVEIVVGIASSSDKSKSAKYIHPLHRDVADTYNDVLDRGKLSSGWCEVHFVEHFPSSHSLWNRAQARRGHDSVTNAKNPSAARCCCCKVRDVVLDSFRLGQILELATAESVYDNRAAFSLQVHSQCSRWNTCSQCVFGDQETSSPTSRASMQTGHSISLRQPKRTAPLSVYRLYRQMMFHMLQLLWLSPSESKCE
jgi:hypothetical protein